jgi:ribosomal protein L32
MTSPKKHQIFGLHTMLQRQRRASHHHRQLPAYQQDAGYGAIQLQHKTCPYPHAKSFGNQNFGEHPQIKR